MQKVFPDQRRPFARWILPFLLIALTLFGLAPPLRAQSTIKMLPRRVRAPLLNNGGEWINTSAPLRLADLRGKFVILDFWTYCCINCMHILPELKKLEHAYPNNLVVIGVHSPKFATERDPDNVREAVFREKIEHPVLSDNNRALWRKYEVDVWPSLRIIDPEGYVIAAHQGEIKFGALDRFLKTAVTRYRRKKLLDETPLRFELEMNKHADAPLRFPGKVLADAASNRVFIADSYHNRIVVANLEGRLLDVIGNGAVGAKDGSYAESSFDHPQGMALRGETLYVADTENHKIRKVDLRAKTVATSAGTGRQRVAQEVRWGARPRGMELASPWDLHIEGEKLFIAMAGTHQIWFMQLDERRIGPYAGNATEDIIDGPLLPRQPFQKGYSSFAQPSGLASDGTWLYVADSEGSSIRAVPFDPTRRVETVMGTSLLSADRLFTFGNRDGPIGQAMLQHPIGVEYHDGKLYVADTYNDKIRLIDLRAKRVTTFLGGRSSPEQKSILNEPSGVSVSGGRLYVADTNGHRIVVADLNNPTSAGVLAIAGLKPPTPPPPTWQSLASAAKLDFPDSVVAAGSEGLRIRLKLNLPKGYKLNPDVAMEVRVQAAGDSMLFDRERLIEIQKQKFKPGDTVTVNAPLASQTGNDRMRVSLAYFYCRESQSSVCRIGEVQWTGKVVVQSGAPKSELVLEHNVKPK